MLLVVLALLLVVETESAHELREDVLQMVRDLPDEHLQELKRHLRTLQGQHRVLPLETCSCACSCCASCGVTTSPPTEPDGSGSGTDPTSCSYTERYDPEKKKCVTDLSKIGIGTSTVAVGTGSLILLLCAVFWTWYCYIRKSSVERAQDERLRNFNILDVPHRGTGAVALPRAKREEFELTPNNAPSDPVKAIETVMQDRSGRRFSPVTESLAHDYPTTTYYRVADGDDTLPPAPRPLSSFIQPRRERGVSGTAIPQPYTKRQAKN